MYYKLNVRNAEAWGALWALQASAHILDEYSKLPIHSNFNDLVAYFNSI